MVKSTKLNFILICRALPSKALEHLSTKMKPLQLLLASLPYQARCHPHNYTCYQQINKQTQLQSANTMTTMHANWDKFHPKLDLASQGLLQRTMQVKIFQALSLPAHSQAANRPDVRPCVFSGLDCKHVQQIPHRNLVLQ